MLEVTPGFIEDMGEQYFAGQTSRNSHYPPRRRLRVYPGQARIYEELATILKQHARGEYIYATPDCPKSIS